MIDWGLFEGAPAKLTDYRLLLKKREQLNCIRYCSTWIAINGLKMSHLLRASTQLITTKISLSVFGDCELATAKLTAKISKSLNEDSKSPRYRGSLRMSRLNCNFPPSDHVDIASTMWQRDKRVHKQKPIIYQMPCIFTKVLRFPFWK